MMQHLQPPQEIPTLSSNLRIFLAGSIDNGKAENWQAKFVEAFADKPITFLNPRREDWNPELEPTLDNPDFEEQVRWEMQGLEVADFIVMYFAPDSKAPISLLELGLFASSGRMLVCCPEGYWRKGNVDFVCRKFSIPTFSNLDELIIAAGAYVKL
ncbi:MAG: nucleoside 2-deoxyribosyltransferase domain-containing protein [Bacteroidota bacterium]